MKNCLLNRRFLYIFLLISLAGFLVLPKFCLADDFNDIDLGKLGKYLELPPGDVQKLMDTLKQVFTTEGILLWSSGDATEEKIAVAITLLKVVTMQALSHLLVDAPIEITWGIVKGAVEMSRIFLDPYGVSVVLNKIEKETVKRAIAYGMDFLVGNELRVTPGAIKFKYYSYKGGEKEIILQYVMIYKPESEKRAQVAIRFYMPNSIEAPDAQKYNKGITSLPIPDLRKDLSPFIVEVSGRVEKDEKLDNYWWIDEKGRRVTEGPEPTLIHPVVNIDFPPVVPDLGIRPLSLWEKYLLKPIETTIKEVEIIITKITGKSPNLVDIWEEVKKFIAKIKSFVPATVVQAPVIETEGQKPLTVKEVEGMISEIEKILKEKEEEVEVKPQPVPQAAGPEMEGEGGPEMTLEELQEMLDDIAERIDILTQKIAKLAEERGVKEDLEEIEEEEELEEKEDTEKKEAGVCIVNINTASKEELQKITGVGPIIAQRIIDARPFSSIYDLIRVSGIGEITLQKIIAQGCAYVDSTFANTGSGPAPTPSPQIILSYPQNNPVNKDIEITLSASNLKNATYDVKISIEKEEVLSEIYNEKLNKWQSSHYYTTSTFSGTSFSGSFKLRIKEQNFRDEADIVAKIRETGKTSSYLEFKGKINITDPEQDEESQEEQLPLTVVINEIAWMGTKASDWDEWIELFNNTTSSIDLAGWKIKKGNEDFITISTSTAATTTILAGGFYLTERDEKAADITADLVYGGQIRLKNNPNCEVLSLYDQNDNLIDQTVCREDGNWPAGEASSNYLSMERINPGLTGSDPVNWANNNLITRNGLDAAGNKINGTPKNENSVSKAFTEISGQIDFPTLTYLGNPYIVKWELTIPQARTLTIEPGVVIKFYNSYSGMIVNGTLKAIGTENEKIIFTSYNPEANYWKQIYFGPTNTDSELVNVRVEYGGEWATADGSCHLYRAAIRVENSSIILKDSILENNKSKGLYLINSSSTIDNVQFLNHRKGCSGSSPYIYGDAIALWIEGSSPTIKNSTFKENTTGIVIQNGVSPVIENNIFEENEKPIYVKNSYPSFKNNQTPGNNNNLNGILVFNSNIAKNTTWQADLPYIIEGTLSISKNVIFTLNPGVVIKFRDGNSEIVVDGTLKAIGTENEKIIFTSYNPEANYWKQIYFSPENTSSQPELISELVNVKVEYGGEWPTSWGCHSYRAAIRVENSSIILKDSILVDNKNRGLYLINSSSTIDNVQFLNHRKGCPTVYIYGDAIALWIEGSSPTIKNSTFKNNYCGIYIQNSNPTLTNLTFGKNEEKNNIDIYPIPP